MGVGVEEVGEQGQEAIDQIVRQGQCHHWRRLRLRASKARDVVAVLVRLAVIRVPGQSFGGLTPGAEPE